MSALWSLVVGLVLAARASALAAEPARDCPLATAPVRAESPLSDVLTHPGGPDAPASVACDLVSGFTRNFGEGGLPLGIA